MVWHKNVADGKNIKPSVKSRRFRVVAPTALKLTEMHSFTETVAAGTGPTQVRA